MLTLQKWLKQRARCQYHDSTEDRAYHIFFECEIWSNYRATPKRKWTPYVGQRRANDTITIWSLAEDRHVCREDAERKEGSEIQIMEVLYLWQ